MSSFRAAARSRVVFGSGYVQVASGRLVREGVRCIRYGVAELDVTCHEDGATPLPGAWGHLVAIAPS